MFHRIKLWIEEHPYLTGALILGVILIWVLRRSSSASQNAQTVRVGPSDALQAAELQAGVQIQSAQLAAQTQVAGYNASVNATQLQYAADVAKTNIGAGVQNLTTSAQLQLGLAQLGFTPSTSPFGLTVPISGVVPVLPGGTTQPVEPVTVVNPGTPTPAPVTQPPVITVTPGVVNVPPNMQQRVPSITESEFAGVTLATTHAGTGGPVTVPSVPIYGPVDAAGVPSFLGYTNPETIPGSTGLNWNQYYRSLSPQLPTTLTPAGVTEETALNIAAQLDYLNNPNSCHNRVCA